MVTVVRIMRSFACIGAVAFVLLFWVDTTKAQSPSTGHVAPVEGCVPFTQSIHEGPTMLATEYYNRGVRVCGASPNCSTCVYMYSEDCTYVFPTNVTVVAKKKEDGEYLCTCQTFACDLPWDPAGWNKKCFRELGCVKQKPQYDNISIEQALCGGDGPNVKFGPLSFGTQSYFTPGLVTSVLYEGKKTPYRQYEIINKFATVSGESTSVHKHEGTIEGGTNGDSLYYTAYRKADALCLKYRGKKNQTTYIDATDYDTCIPIPLPERPVVYVSESDNGLVENPVKGESIAVLEDAMYRNSKIYTNMMTSSQYLNFIRRSASTSDYKRLLNVLKESSGMQYLCMQRKNLFGDACFDTKTSVELPKDVTYQDNDGCSMKEIKSDTGGDKPEVVARYFPGYVLSRFKYISDKMADINLAVVGPNGECRVAEKHIRKNEQQEEIFAYQDVSKKCEYTEMPVMSEYEHTMESNNGAAMEKRGKETSLVSKIISRYKDGAITTRALFDYYATGEVVCFNNMPQGDVEFEVLPRASDNCSDGAACKSGRGDRFRVRKKPKMLRRYVMVGEGEKRRRARCDDKYSIDLYALSQTVLDRSVVLGNKFVLPQDYLMSTVSDTTQDPCYSSKSEIVYFYEDGGFISSGVDLKKCWNPVTEYYAPDKAARGCEYSYVRSDNHEPFLQEAGSVSGFSIVPLSKYEQGFCIDNFSRFLFEPKYRKRSASPSTVPQPTTSPSECCVKRGDTSASGVITMYRFPINNESFAVSFSKGELGSDQWLSERKGNRKCTFYKVEMWGGGEAATLEDGKEDRKRSGRPGQYVSLLLDLKNVEYEKSTDSNEGKKKISLVMKIGEGGKKGGGNSRGESANATTSEKGEDTILYLCRDSEGAKGSSLVWPHTGTDNPQYTKQPEAQQQAPQSTVANCDEIARAVGGGSDILGEPRYYPGSSVLKYYRTISADVLKGDNSGIKLLRGGEAMFTKIPIEVNMYYDKGGTTFATGGYLAQRSLPKEFCKYRKGTYEDATKSETGITSSLIIPGMGGCWGKESSNGTPTTASNDDKPGAGGNGAVIITCERWKNGSGVNNDYMRR